MNINPYERFAPFLVDAYRGGRGPEGGRMVRLRCFNRGVAQDQTARLAALNDSSLTRAEITAGLIFMVGMLPAAVCSVLAAAHFLVWLFVSREAAGGLSLLDPWIVFPALVGGVVFGGSVHYVADFRRTKAWALANDAAWDELGPSLVLLEHLPGARGKNAEGLSTVASSAYQSLKAVEPAHRYAPAGLQLLEDARTAIGAYIDAPVPSKDGAAMVAATHLTDPGVLRAAEAYLAAVEAEKDALTAATVAVDACTAFARQARQEAEDRRLVELANS